MRGGSLWDGKTSARKPVKSPAKHRKRCREHLEIPLSVCPELDNQILNLKLLPGSLNSSKRDKVTERAKAFAKELHDAKLLSGTSWERIQLAGGTKKKRSLTKNTVRKGLYLLVYLALGGPAKAQLGLSYGEIEKQVGKLEILEPDKWTGEHIPPGIIRARAFGKKGFDEVIYFFLKQKKTSEEKCLKIKYIKKYQSYEAIKFIPQEASTLVKENFPSIQNKMKTTTTEGLQGDKVLKPWWKEEWQGPDGEKANAQAELTPGMTYQFVVSCSSKEWTRLEQQEESEKQTVYKTAQ